MIMLVPNYPRNYSITIICSNSLGRYRSIHKGIVSAIDIKSALLQAKEDVRILKLRGEIKIFVSSYDTTGCHPCTYKSHYYIDTNYEGQEL